MSNKPEFTASLQENVLAVLGFDNANSKIIAGLIDSSLFEGDYQLIAERCIEYIREYGHAPGRAHIHDILSDILEDEDSKSKRTIARIIDQMHALSAEMDTRYILDRLSKFVRLQTLKRTTLEVAEKLQSGQEHSIGEVEALWHSILKADQVGFSPGMRGTAISRVIEHVRTQHSEFYTGIPIFDQRGIVPSRGTADLLIGPTNTGKSWWLVNLGKQAVIQRKKVLHITLEMSEEEVGARYYQTFCSVGSVDKTSMVTEFERDDEDRVVGMRFSKFESDFTLNSPWARDELKAYISASGKMFDNLIIKRFPTGSLTIAQLEAYLDTLVRIEGFVPDMVILDYLGLLKVAHNKEFRLALGDAFKDARGLAIERNHALVTANQSNRTGATAQVVGLADIAEDWSLTGTADQVFTYTSTPMEQAYNLARIFAAKVRTRRGRFMIAITQNYAVGQFCLDSYILNDEYWDMLKRLDKKHKDEDEDDEYDDESGGDEEDEFDD